MSHRSFPKLGRRIWFLAIALAVGLVACSDGTADVTGRDTHAPADGRSDASLDTGAADVAGDVAVVSDAGGDGADAGDEPACAATRPGEGEVRAKVIVCDDELIGGPLAAGRLGDILIENHLARFIVRAGPEAYALAGLPGGDVVDADIVRLPGEQGADQLHEIISFVSGNTLDVESISVVDDGKSGSARVQVVGRPRAYPIIATVLPPQDIAGTVIHEYELTPDVPYLTLRTTVRPDEDASAAQVLPIEGFFVGGDVPVFKPGEGFADADTYNGPFLSWRGEHVSYGYETGGRLQVVDTGALKLLIGNAAGVRPGEELTLTRHFVVGSRDLDSVVRELYALREMPSAMVTGTVTPSDGADPGIYEIAVDDGAGRPQTLFRTDESGAFAGAAPLGDLNLRATCAGCVDGAPVAVTLDAEGASGVELTGNAPGMLRIEVEDGDGTSLPARVTLTPTEPRRERRSLLVGREPATYAVRPGGYSALVSRGFEYETVRQAEVNVVAGETATLSATLARVVETPGAVAAEFHIHSDNSVDTGVPLGDRVLSCVAEGLEFVVATDHDFVTDYGPTVAALGLEDYLATAVGSEISSVDAGHFNAWPLTQDCARAGCGAFAWEGLPPAELARQLREAHPGCVVQTNHPRFQDGSTFDIIDFHTDDGLAHADPADLGFPPGTDLDELPLDSYEVYNGIGDEELEEELLDWYSLLNHGHRITATAGGDSHDLEAFPGHPRNYVLVGEDEPSELTVAAVNDAVRAMRVVVSTGPYVELSVADPATGEARGLGEVVTMNGGEATLSIRVQAPSWMSVDHFDIVANGVAVEHVDIADPGDPAQRAVVRFEDDVTLPLTGDAWVVVRVGGSGRDPDLARLLPFALTNPVFLDVDGNGAFDAPGS